VSDYTAGGVGPGSALRQDPTQPAGPQNPAVAFTGFNAGPLKASAGDPNDPANMLVLVTDELWTPSAKQLAVNNGHVCVAVNAYGSISGVVPSPAGGPLTDPFLDPACGRTFGQRNIQIVAVPEGNHIVTPMIMLVPATDRCPLRGVIATRAVQLPAGPDGVLRNVPELAQAASEHGIQTLRRPERDPLQHVKIGNGDGHHDDDNDDDHHGDHHPHHNGNGNGFGVNLEPGERANLKVTVDAQHQRPGDAYAVDLLTTDAPTKQLFGAARIYVLVTN
jgi:hypothetical protein